MSDHVEAVVQAWRTAQPEWDLTGMALLGRISRVERLLEVRRTEVLRADGLTTADVDVLAGLWRHPGGQRPRDLRKTMMIGSGTLTPRLDRLEADGWLERHPDSSC
jgi:DNA-binding MarR family transcriptional regulator